MCMHRWRHRCSKKYLRKVFCFRWHLKEYDEIVNEARPISSVSPQMLIFLQKCISNHEAKQSSKFQSDPSSNCFTIDVWKKSNLTKVLEWYFGNRYRCNIYLRQKSVQVWEWTNHIKFIISLKSVFCYGLDNVENLNVHVQTSWSSVNTILSTQLLMLTDLVDAGRSGVSDPFYKNNKHC